MHKNKVWLAFLGIVFICTLWMTGKAYYLYREYDSLNKQTPVEAMAWHLQENASDNYTLTADYTFKVHDKQFSGSTPFSERFRNRATAEQEINENKSKNWEVWYDDADPNFSTLKKYLPFKEYIYAIVLWVIFIYFLWLGFYVKIKTPI